MRRLGGRKRGEGYGVRRSAGARKQQLINHQSARKRKPIMDGAS